MLVYLTFAAFSTWKFMFTPLAGPSADLTFWETYFSCTLGGLFSVSLFYFSSIKFLKEAQLNQVIEKKRFYKLKIKGVKKKKVFSRKNRNILKFKHRFNFVVMCWLFPLFLSIPLGTIITTKFYRHNKLTYPLIVIFMFFNGLIFTSIAYLFFQ